MPSLDSKEKRRHTAPAFGLLLLCFHLRASAGRVVCPHPTRPTPPTLPGEPTMFWLRTSAVLFAAVALYCPSPARAADDDVAARQVELKKGDRIIFFGDSLTAAGRAGGAQGARHEGLRPHRPRDAAREAQGQEHRSRLGRHRRAHGSRPAQARRQGRDRQEADHRGHPDRLQRRPPHPQGDVQERAWRS